MNSLGGFILAFDISVAIQLTKKLPLGELATYLLLLLTPANLSAAFFTTLNYPDLVFFFVVLFFPLIKDS